MAADDRLAHDTSKTENECQMSLDETVDRPVSRVDTESFETFQEIKKSCHGLACLVLDEINKYIAFFTRRLGDHIQSLYEQMAEENTIVIIENPQLHLVWHYQKLYLELIPTQLLI